MAARIRHNNNNDKIQRNVPSNHTKMTSRFARSSLLLPLMFLVLVAAGGCLVVLSSFQMLRTSARSDSNVEPDLKPQVLLNHEKEKRKQEVHSLSTRGEEERQLKLPTPVIVLGFPKSGTTSIFQFFTCSGARTQHFCCCNDTSDHPPCRVNTMANCILNNTAHKQTTVSPPPKLLDGCGDYQVYAQIDGERPIRHIRGRPNYKGVLLDDGTLEKHNIKQSNERTLLFRHFLPQHFLLDQLHADYPQATYILSLRDPHQWANSVFNWYQMRGRVVNEYRFFNKSMEKPGKARAKEWLARIYNEHSDYVREFVTQHPSHTLVSVNITDPQAGTKLAQAFGLEEQCWGHHNKMGNRANEEKNRKRRQEQQRQQ